MPPINNQVRLVMNRLALWIMSVVAFMAGARVLNHFGFDEIIGFPGSTLLGNLEFDQTFFTQLITAVLVTWTFGLPRSSTVASLGVLVAWAPVLRCYFGQIDCQFGVAVFPIYSLSIIGCYHLRKNIPKETWYVGLALGVALLLIFFALALLVLNTMFGLSFNEVNLLVPVGAVAWFITSIFRNVQTRRKRPETLLR